MIAEPDFEQGGFKIFTGYQPELSMVFADLDSLAGEIVKPVLVFGYCAGFKVSVEPVDACLQLLHCFGRLIFFKALAPGID